MENHINNSDAIEEPKTVLYSRNTLLGFPKDHLVDIITELKSNVTEESFNRIVKNINKDSKQVLKRKKNKSANVRACDFTKYRTRHITLNFCYMGEKFDGLARQKNTDETIERYLADALVSTTLIQNFESCRYSRCGRTDKGVSAFSQVVSLVVRSQVPVNVSLLPGKSLDDYGPHNNVIPVLRQSDDADNGTSSSTSITEMPYCQKLNGSLPSAIRVYQWSVAPENFDARFSTLYRTYKYFFIPSPDLDLRVMTAAAKSFVGFHDFRNFCQKDPSGAMNYYMRRIYKFELKTVDGMAYFEICGAAFLWHQVRCMSAILFLIGQGLEEPNIIEKMLDVENSVTRKPDYTMASYLPLVLQQCAYEDLELEADPSALRDVFLSVKSQWEEMTIRTSLLRNKLDSLERIVVPNTTSNILQDDSSSSSHVKFGELLNSKIFAKRRKPRRPLLER